MALPLTWGQLLSLSKLSFSFPYLQNGNVSVRILWLQATEMDSLMPRRIIY